jgi:RNA polymerase sigma-70 factor, ECF subfamily
MQPSVAGMGCLAGRDTPRTVDRVDANGDRMSSSAADFPDARATFDRLLAELRPKLHRYCARMAGSVIDGEDLVHEAFVKAIEALPEAGAVSNPEGWLFRIAHNTALDFLRRRSRQDAVFSDEDVDLIVEPVSDLPHRGAATSLRTFMRLPAAQRSSVILMDVLGYSLEEISQIMDRSIAAIKAALHRGRARLRELSQETNTLPPPALTQQERLLLARYVERFNARDFDAIRDMLAEEVRLELVNKRRVSGRSELGGYFFNYAQLQDWMLVAGYVDRHPAALVCDPHDPTKTPVYFILLQWAGGRVATIRDFRFACYAMEGAELSAMD